MKIGFIGVGNMGSALARAASKAEGASAFLYDKDGERAMIIANEIKAKTCTLLEIADSCDYIFLGVKPNQIESVIKEIADNLSKRAAKPTIISMAAGVSTDKISNAIPFSIPIIRIMPNTPAAIGAGVILYCTNALIGEKEEKDFLRFMEGAGSIHRISEAKIDAASAVSGCGPAFVYTFIDAIAKGGESCGLDREEALLYTLETVIGAARLALQSTKAPDELRDEVCSPGGSTIEGVHALAEGNFSEVAERAVIASYDKTLKLGK